MRDGAMFRKTSGAILCPSCGRLTNADAPVCLVCGRRNPGMWGFGGALGLLFRRWNFTNAVTAACVALYVISLIFDPLAALRPRGFLEVFSPSAEALWAMGADPVHHGLLHGGREQLGSRRRVRGRLPLRARALPRRASRRDGARQAPRGRRDPGDPRRLRARPLDRIRRLSATTPGSERPGRLGEYRGGRGAPRDVIYPGSDLLSHAVASGVPSAREGLTSVFGMGTGVAPPALPPGSRPGAHRTPGTEYGDPRVQPDAASPDQEMHENTVVKPHGRLVPVS